jgi:DNA modification methylase
MVTAEIITGDCLEVMRGMAGESIDACVTDPPYGLRFMGKQWDYQIPSVEIFKEIYRTLKDGSRLLCFAGTRTMHRMWVNIEDAGFTIEDTIMWVYGSGFPKHKSKLKPAYEPICVARKGRSAELNIDGCRIEHITVNGGNLADNPHLRGTKLRSAPVVTSFGVEGDVTPLTSQQGRWPANIIFDEEAGEMLDEQSGTSRSTGGLNPHVQAAPISAHGGFAEKENRPYFNYGDVGGASRFFYCAKASRAERNAGLEGMPQRVAHDDVRMNGGGSLPQQTPNQHRPQGNHHPTVKPISLMRHLCRLIAPKGSVILDPFAGSGSTGIACAQEGFDFIGIERDPEYVEIARCRIKHAQGQWAEIPKRVTNDKPMPLFDVA